MLDCTILGISQALDFESNVTTTYLSLRLPGGTTVQAAVDDDAASAIVALQVAAKGAPKPTTTTAPPVARAAPPRARMPEPPSAEEEKLAHPDYEEPPDGDLRPQGDSVFVFGGQDSTPEEAEALAEGSPTLMEPERKQASPDQDLGAVLADAPPSPPARNKASLKAPPRSRMQQLPNGKKVVPSRTVQPLAGGYPTVRDGVDTGELTGGRDKDENGVGSV